MGYNVIITTTSLCWVLLTIGSTLTIFAAVFSPKWLIGPVPSGSENGPNIPSVGIFNRCTRLNCANFALDGLFTDSSVFPTWWKISLVLFMLGILIMTFCTITALSSCCIQSCLKKSIFTVTGTFQSLAGLLYIIGLTMYAVGWGSERLKRLCGPSARPFEIGDCTLASVAVARERALSSVTPMAVKPFSVVVKK